MFKVHARGPNEVFTTDHWLLQPPLAAQCARSTLNPGPVVAALPTPEAAASANRKTPRIFLNSEAFLMETTIAILVILDSSRMRGRPQPVHKAGRSAPSEYISA